MANVGLFFYVKGKLLADMTDIEHSELYGDFKIGRSSHYDIWNKKYYAIYKKPYDYYPRGRVVYKYKENKYILYADRCIDKEGINKVIHTFGIEDENIEIGRDEHYVCKRCNKDYVE